MPSKNESWGIEVGAEAVKAMHLVKSGNGVEMQHFEVIPHKQVLTAPDVNVEEAIQLDLTTLSNKHDLSKAQTVVSVPGHMAFARFATLPPVAQKELPKIVTYEAQQQIPFPIDEVEWDYHIFQEEDNPDVRVGIFAITKERVINFLNNFRRLDIRVDQLTLSPLAVYNALQYDDPLGEDAPGTIYMDIGSQCTDVIFVQDGELWVRTLPLGGNQFTEAICRQFKVSFAKAEKLKREAATSKHTRAIMSAMRSVFADLVQELQRSIGYYQSMNRDADIQRLVALGSSFRLPGFRTFLQKNLDIEVIKPSGFKQVQAPGSQESELSDQAISLTTAYGLALQGLGMNTVDSNVLPAYILNQRMWKNKQPWFAGAAACLAGAAVLTGIKVFADRSADAADWPQAESNMRQAINLSSQKQGAYQQVAAENKNPQIESYMAVRDYQDIPAYLYLDVMTAIQQSSGTPALVASQGGPLVPQYDPAERIYLEWIDTTYQAIPAGENGQQGGRGGLASGVDVSIFASPTEPATFFPPEGSADAAGGYDQYGEPVEVDPNAPPPVKGPRMTVRVSVVTASENALGKIDSDFLGYLISQAETNNRPYRILVLNRTEAVTRQVVPRVEASEQTPSGGRTGGRPSGGRTETRPTESRDGEDVRRPPQRGGSSSNPRENNVNRDAIRVNATFDSLLPERDEDQDPFQLGDETIRLIIEWQIELLPPNEVRQLEQLNVQALGEYQMPNDAAWSLAHSVEEMDQ